ncbi:MAG: YbjN domain-containing protein [Cyclobacteriaceae bacterium]|nr:YbjN domain-containing protein [Cyclobacteriaceae bacterium HetDA_MAG_MS6]
MNSYFQKVKEYLLELNYTIVQEDEKDGVFVVENEEEGIKNVVLIVADPILIVEQFLFELSSDSQSIFKKLLMKNRDIIHGAFALDESGKKVLFRNTHECENLDLNEIEATLNSLALLLGEYTDQLIEFSKQ